MAQVIKIEGMEDLIGKLKGKSSKYKKANVVVGYTANYAVYVHENTEMKLKGQPRAKPRKGRYWDPQGRGQSKFLEKPARQLANSGQLGTLIAQAVRGGASLAQALAIGGLRIQRESQKIVPVDTGNLKASAFTRKD